MAVARSFLLARSAPPRSSCSASGYPVLSEQMTCVQPSVSTAVSRRMTALRLDMFVTPMDSTTVTTVARPSGMAATASETATMKVSQSGLGR